MTKYIPELATPEQRLDEAAIRALSDRYTDAVNHRDWATYRDCWTEDAVWDLGPPVNQRKDGLDAIMEEVQRAVGAMDLFVQMPHAFTLLKLDGDGATTRTTLNEVGRILPESRDLLGGAEGVNILAIYTDRVVRGDDGRWRFSRRSYRFALFSGQAPQGDVIPAAS
jgi:ketosteroid isomerase-like protein